MSVICKALDCDFKDMVDYIEDEEVSESWHRKNKPELL